MSSASSNSEHMAIRLIDHVNKDHIHNLEDYLIVYGNVDANLASRKPTLENLQLGSMTISYIDMEGTKNFIRLPIEPCLDDLREARGKFIEMSQHASRKRGFSEHLIDRVPYPNSLKDAFAFVLFFGMWILAAKPDLLFWLVNALKLTTQWKEQILAWESKVFRGLIMLHSAEAMLILYPLLRKHRMGTAKKIICLALCLIEGVFFLGKFKDVIDSSSSKGKKEI
ncbi:hypothetical protein DAMA08_036390 [Martiniozyma asiatica (nom. inval.)]|nr:hypothetical protein DAMA08_036390 [Martiniozyma asiatica]